MIYSPIIIIGSGPSGTTAAYSLIEEKKDVLLIDNGYNKDTIIKDVNENLNIFHPKIKNKDFKFVLHDFIKKNKISQTNFSATGSLAIGGLSNIWGGGYWNYLDKIYDNNFNNFLKENFDVLNFEKSSSDNLTDFLNQNSSFSKYKSAQLLSFKNSKEIFNSAELINKLKTSKNFKYVKGSFIKEVIQEDKFYILIDENEKKFKCEKLILACGTIGSTRLVMKLNKLVNMKQKLLHNISYGFVGKLNEKKIYSQVEKHTPGSIFIFNDSETKKTVCGSIGRYSNELGTLINTNFSFPLNMFVKNTVKILKNYLIFGKIFMPVEFSNTKIYLTNDDKIMIEGSKNINLKKEEAEIINRFFIGNKKVYKILYNKELPLGSDSHYTSTMSSNNDIEDLKTNENGELLKRKNLFVVDASIIGKKGSHFPTFEIMENAYKIGKDISKHDFK